MKRKTHNLKHLIATTLIFSFFFSPLLVFAQNEIEEEVTAEIEQVAKQPTEILEDFVKTEEVLEESISEEGSDLVIELPETTSTTEELVVEVEEVPQESSSAPEKKITQKIQTDKSLPISDQLERVREELSKRDFSDDILLRIDEFEERQKTSQPEKNFFERLIDRVRGETPEQKERAYIEKEAKKRPFAVVSSDTPPNTRIESSFINDFKNNAEKKSLREKIKGLFEGNMLKNAVNSALSFFGLRKEVIAQASENPNDYLAEEGEIQFSQSVQNLATSLNYDPLKLLNHVRNNIEFVPYYGSKKGSDATLIERAGNDTDQAALLIALLRNSNIPARYKQADVKIDIRTVTDLLGVTNAIAAAQVLTLSNIPYILYIDQNNGPLFFVLEHTYVEAYMPYGYTRGVDLADGGAAQWVPMDPSIKSVYYEQLVDIMGDMNTNGFSVETFFENYLDGDHGISTPVEAFRTQVADHLLAHPPQSYPNLTYDDALVRKYANNNNFEFIPGTLPYEVVADLATYQKIPNELRHTLTFTIQDESQSQTYLTHTVYVSDLANKEVTITYDAASPADQQVIDSFDTIYDVVPLSLVHVLPTIKVNGTQIAQATASTTLGQNQHYSLEFKSPTREIGASVTTQSIDTIEKDIIVGNTEAIAFDTDRVVPPELRPSQDTQTQSFVNAQKLFKTAQNYLYRLEETQEELSNVIGGDFNDLATRAIVFNGLQVTYQNNQPYSFDWKGLRIDASAKVSYFNRFFPETATYQKEFSTLFGLEASHNESQIFEDDYNILAIATTKGLRLVSQNQFVNTILVKITPENEGLINTLTNLSTTTRAIFHTAVQEGNTIYTSNKPITYGTWTGLVYINIDPATGSAGYIIGEGLNGGYTIEQWPEGWSNFWRILAIGIAAIINSPTNGQTFNYGDPIPWNTHYTNNLQSWDDILTLDSKNYDTGNITLKSGYSTNESVDIRIQKTTLGEEGSHNDFDQEVIYAVAANGLPPQFASVLKLMINRESGFETLSLRYEPCVDKEEVYELIEVDTQVFDYRVNTFPFVAWRLPGQMPSTPALQKGTQVESLKIRHGYTPQEIVKKFSRGAGRSWEMKINEGDTIYAVWSKNDAAHGYTTESYCDSADITPASANFPAQPLLASSYGLGQIVFAYHWNKFDPEPPVRDIWEMFARKTNIEISTSIFKQIYNNYAGVQGINCEPGDRLWRTIGSYNGNINLPKAQNYANQICGQYKTLNYQVITN